jgi:tRNA (cmo5U34)-methyltransferase
MPVAANYRWNTSAAAEAFDQAAQHIHPLYTTVQDEILSRLPFDAAESLLLVDLGGGSGRLVERVLEQFSGARAVVVDQSEPFLALAERRLQRFGQRAAFLKHRLQDDWLADLPAAPQAIVSMSAIHHLDPGEKQTLYARCFESLAPGGLLMNGDEYRPESDADYLAALQRWSDHKDAASQQGLIPKSFDPVFDAWYDRNIRRFGQPQQSGDDCHETIASQIATLQNVGFGRVEAVWAEGMWGLLTAVKPAGGGKPL